MPLPENMEYLKRMKVLHTGNMQEGELAVKSYVAIHGACQVNAELAYT